MTSRVRSKNIEKMAKRKIMSKKETKQKKKMVQRNRTQPRKITLSAYFKAISYYFGFSESIELALLNLVEN